MSYYEPEPASPNDAFFAFLLLMLVVVYLLTN